VYAVEDENPQLAQLLADAEDEAIELANDADDTQNLISSDEKLGESRLDAGSSEGARTESCPDHR